MHVPDNKRVKLDAKSFKCILLGVSEESKAYRLFDPIANKIIVSRDVIFEEDQQWSWDDGHKQAILTDIEWETDDKAGIEDENNGDEFEADEEPGEFEPETNQNGGDTSTGENSSPERRARRPPVWMGDYETGQGLSDEEGADMTHLALFSDGDPVTFEEAVKSKKWRQAMDQEIQAIKRNDT